MKLIKLSHPGWVKDFTNETYLLEFFKDCICIDCYKGAKYYNENGSLWDEEPPIDKNTATLEELLGTLCGCEFMVEGG